MNSELDKDELQFPPESSIRIPEQIIEALIDMEEYDGFCAFCYRFWIDSDKSNMQNFTFETLSNNYFINLKIEKHEKN